MERTGDVMCSPQAALGAGAGVSVIGNYYLQKQQAENAQEQMNEQAKASIKEMNYAFKNYELEREDAFDSAIADITRIKANSLQLNSAVKNAVLENDGSGNTARMLIRNAEGDTAEATASVKDNYERKSNEIDLNKETALEQTKSKINAINYSAPKMPSRFANFLSTAGTSLSAYSQAKGIAQAKNLDTYGDTAWNGFSVSGGGSATANNLLGTNDYNYTKWEGLKIRG